jgi:hypothetical protein
MSIRLLRNAYDAGTLAAVQSPASIPPPWQVVRDGGGDLLPRWQ